MKIGKSQCLVHKIIYNLFQSGSGTFDSLQTLVEVSSLLADQDGQYQVSVGVTL